MITTEIERELTRLNIDFRLLNFIIINLITLSHSGFIGHVTEICDSYRNSEQNNVANCKSIQTSLN